MAGGGGRLFLEKRLLVLHGSRPSKGWPTPVTLCGRNVPDDGWPQSKGTLRETQMKEKKLMSSFSCLIAVSIGIEHDPPLLVFIGSVEDGSSDRMSPALVAALCRHFVPIKQLMLRGQWSVLCCQLIV